MAAGQKNSVAGGRSQLSAPSTLERDTLLEVDSSRQDTGLEAGGGPHAAPVNADLVVTIADSAIRCISSMSAAERRVLAMSFAGFASAPPAPTANSGFKVRLHASQTSASYKAQPNVAYEDLKSAVESLFDRSVRHRIHGAKGRFRELRFRWISGVTYLRAEGLIEFNMSPELVDILHTRLGEIRGLVSARVSSSSHPIERQRSDVVSPGRANDRSPLG